MEHQKKYKTILADPPWKYGKGWGWGAGEYYNLMSLEDIKNLPVNNLAEENAHLYLWCPNGMIPQGLEVMQSWGFKFKTILTWVKNRSIFGYYFKGQSEQILFGVKGKLAPQDRKQVTILNGVVRNHSRKPDEQYGVIEKISPAPRIELFARHKKQGWDCFGNEVDSDVQLIAKSKTQGATPSFNKDLTATQQVATPKCPSDTSLNPDIKRNRFLK
jgi:N6-adenosine-specific RNA methylase IME4